jgi:CrcB protein
VCLLPLARANRRTFYGEPVPTVLLVAIGGVVGSLCRFGIAELVPASTADGWPWPTLIVNVVGALVIGIVASRLHRSPSWVGPTVITGFLGGFTTFSAIAVETTLMLDGGRAGAAVGYVAVTLAAGLVGARIGAVGAPPREAA